jgi:hypothetical protein
MLEILRATRDVEPQGVGTIVRSKARVVDPLVTVGRRMVRVSVDQEEGCGNILRAPSGGFGRGVGPRDRDCRVEPRPRCVRTSPDEDLTALEPTSGK